MPKENASLISRFSKLFFSKINLYMRKILFYIFDLYFFTKDYFVFRLYAIWRYFMYENNNKDILEEIF